MKKYCLLCFLFSLPILFILIFIELSLRQIPNRYAFKNNLLKEKGKCIKHIVIGSSVAGDGINPSYLPDGTYNLALPAQWIRWNKALLEKNIENLPNLQSVILGIAYQAMWSDQLMDNGAFKFKRGKEDEHHLTCHNIYMGICFDKINPLRYFEFISCPKLSWEKWLKHYILKEDVISYDSLGFYKIGNELKDDRFDDMAKTVRYYTRKKNEISEDMYIRNIQIIHDLAKLCRKKGVSLHLVVTPHYKTFCQSSDFEQVNEMQLALKEISERWENVHMYDYFDDSRFVEEDFANGNHLTYDTGAQKFSKILCKDLYGIVK